MMDIQGFEKPVMESMPELLSSGRVKMFAIGTHSGEIHRACKQALLNAGYQILHASPPNSVPLQPDGILLGVRGDWDRATAITQVVDTAEKNIGAAYPDFLAAVVKK